MCRNKAIAIYQTHVFAGVTFGASERDGISTPGGAIVTSASHMALLTGDAMLRPDSGTCDSGSTFRNILHVDDGKSTLAPNLHDLTASSTIFSDCGSDWTFPARGDLEAWHRAYSQHPDGFLSSGRAATCTAPFARPNTPAEERARAWRPYTAGGAGEINREVRGHSSDM